MIRGEKYIAPAAATLALAVGLGGTACGGKANCLSPRRESKVYPGEYPRARGGNPINWPDAVVIKTHIPDGAKGIVFSFEVPGSNHWKSALPMPPHKVYTVPFRIGPSAVEFGTQIEAKSGSELCQKPPESTFGQPEPFAKTLDQSSGYIPNPNSWSYNK